MNKKAQLSLDLMITIIAAMVFFNLVYFYSDSFSQSSAFISVSYQEHQIASDLRQVVTLSKILNKGDYNVSIPTPKIMDPSHPLSRDCNIDFRVGDTYYIDVNYLSEDANRVETTMDLNYLPATLYNTRFICGGQIDYHG